MCDISKLHLSPSFPSRPATTVSTSKSTPALWQPPSPHNACLCKNPPQPHTPPHTLTHLHTLSSFSQCRDLGDTKWPRGECILLPATEQTSISGTSVNEFSWALMCCNADEVGSHHATINSLTLSTPSSLSQLAFRNMMVLKSMLVIVFKDHMTSCSAGHQ